MPRRLPEKNVTTDKKPRRPRRFEVNGHQPDIFQQIHVSEGKEIEVVIDDVGNKGDGIARVQGFLIFVPQARIGKRLRVKIVKVERKYAIAEKITP